MYLEEPRVIDSILYSPIANLPFTKPKSRIECNRKRGAHLYNDTVLLSDLPQLEQTEHGQLPPAAVPDSLEELLLSEELLPASTEAFIYWTTQNKPVRQAITVNKFIPLTYLLGFPPSDEEQMEFLSKISIFKPVICSIVPPHSDLFKPMSTVVNLPSPLPELYHQKIKN